jgi:hypothetical protein
MTWKVFGRFERGPLRRSSEGGENSKAGIFEIRV